jgi:hypothetical protein
MPLSKIQGINGQVTPNLGRRNMLINGDFQVWQRGTSGTVNSYTCDRWYGWGNQHNLTQQQAENGTHNSGRFALRVAHNDGTSNTFSSIAQTLETKDAAQCRGKKVTFSIDVKKGSAFTGSLTLQIVTRTDAEGTINTGTRQVLVTEDITSSLTTDLQRFTCTTSSVCAQNIRVIGVNVNHTGTSGTDANNYFQVERAQLEIGEEATEFESISFGETFSLCQRYYVNEGFGTNDGGISSPQRDAQYGHVRQAIIKFPVEMRAAPTVSIQSSTSNSLDRYGRGQETCYPIAENVYAWGFGNIIKKDASGNNTSWQDDGNYIVRGGYKAEVEF